MDVFSILLILCVSVIAVIVDGYWVFQYLSPLDKHRSRTGYIAVIVSLRPLS